MILLNWNNGRLNTSTEQTFLTAVLAMYLAMKQLVNISLSLKKVTSFLFNWQEMKRLLLGSQMMVRESLTSVQVVIKLNLPLLLSMEIPITLMHVVTWLQMVNTHQMVKMFIVSCQMVSCWAMPSMLMLTVILTFITIKVKCTRVVTLNLM